MTPLQTCSESAPCAQSEPWWRHATLWLVVGGPAIVVVASFITLYLALRTPDPLSNRGARTTGEATSATEEKRLLPAIEGRNHAATPQRSP
ncbi:Nitrogen fixation protein FixH [Burkholderiales bacterium 8X]|nr:Nitrogen fixation protein FixH [Burkholderiales bacterium 8X]